MANVKATMTDIRVIIRELSRGTDITTGDGAQAETQPHIFEELPGPCGSIRQEHGGAPCLERCGTSGNHAERRRASRQGLRQVWLHAGESRRLCKGHDAQARRELRTMQGT